MLISADAPGPGGDEDEALTPDFARRAPLMYRGPGPRLPPSPARAEFERVNVHVGLTTRTPGEALSGKWEAEWWNGPTRPVREYATEEELIADMRRTFGPPEGDDPTAIIQSTAEKITRDLPPPGSPVPASTTLAARYNVSITTARRAVQHLASQGTITKKNRNYYVPRR